MDCNSGDGSGQGATIGNAQSRRMLSPKQLRIASAQMDMRCGMDRLLVEVRVKPDRDAVDGGVVRLLMEHLNYELLFLRDIERHLLQPSLVIWEGLKAYGCVLVRDYLDAIGGQIVIAFPQPYAPGFNPVE